ncbi:MAG: BON domain-containing protein [Pseudomonadales bacterium]|nr:BON domain-containing protein [Pseudomonadales bacterium]
MPGLILFYLIGCSSLVGPIPEDYGKRSLGTKIDDQMVESRGLANIKDAQPDMKRAHINLTSYNGIALLTGQVPSQAAFDSATNAISGLRKVRVVHNQLEIAGPISLMARTNDTLLTGKVKTALLANQDVSANRIKVVTENNIVYLMGLLTRTEADTAAECSRGVFGVQKIVKVFEYIN